MRLAMNDFRDAVKEAHRICRDQLHMVPVVSNGIVYCGNSKTIPLPQPGISTEDYALGMEALGANFWLIDNGGALSLMCPVGLPTEHAPDNWHARAVALQDVFSPNRQRELADCLLARGDRPIRVQSKEAPK